MTNYFLILLMKRSQNKRLQKVVGMYSCKTKAFWGHRYSDIMPQSRKVFRALQKKTKRQPYVRSMFFKKDKVFFDYFWTHLNEKSVHDRARRLKYLPCVLELLRISTCQPETFIKPQSNAIYHQFEGKTEDDILFSVIVKQDRASGKKYLLSIFPHGERANGNPTRCRCRDRRRRFP